jgi:hypothetical protein
MMQVWLTRPIVTDIIIFATLKAGPFKMPNFFVFETHIQSLTAFGFHNGKKEFSFFA